MPSHTVTARGGRRGLLINLPMGITTYGSARAAQLTEKFCRFGGELRRIYQLPWWDVWANGRAWSRELLLMLLLRRKLCLSGDQGRHAWPQNARKCRLYGKTCQKSYLPLPHPQLLSAPTTIRCVCQNVRDFDFDFVAVRCAKYLHVSVYLWAGCVCVELGICEGVGKRLATFGCIWRVVHSPGFKLFACFGCGCRRCCRCACCSCSCCSS